MKKTASSYFDTKMLKNKGKVWCLMAPAVVQDFSQRCKILQKYLNT